MALIWYQNDRNEISEILGALAAFLGVIRGGQIEKIAQKITRMYTFCEVNLNRLALMVS